MKANTILAMVIALVPHSGSAQQDSLVDVFPLAVGNRWTYDYSTFMLEPPKDVISTDSGRVQYTVSARLVYDDSTVWSLLESRNLMHCRRAFPPMPGFDTCYRIVDEQTRLLVERHAGRHQLYAAIAYWADVFPFKSNMTDTTSMFRYRLVDSSGGANIRISEPSLFCAHTYLLRLQRGIGMLAIECSIRTCTDIHRTRHSLESYTLVSVSEPGLPVFATLSQNYPNPFNPETKIGFGIQEAGFVSLRVFDVRGREVATLVNDVKQPGSYEVRWDGHAVASGVYFYRLQAGRFVQTRKLLLLR